MRRIKMLTILVLTLLLLTSPVLAQNRAPEKWPDIPLIQIETVDGVMPSYTVAYPPEGFPGVSIKDNSYVPGRMVMSLASETLYDSGDYEKDVSGMRIKVRGNSTGANLPQHPYKIKLTKKDDLLRRGDKIFKSKNWALLSMSTWHPSLPNTESNTLTLFSHEVARYSGMPWQPEMEFVNVVINGEYHGMYYLIESVEKGDSRVPVTASGFLIENDPYWWNEDGVFFKTDHQYKYTGYTYKYPDSDDVDDTINSAICGWMNEMEDALWNKRNVERYIDYNTFARWIIAHDFLGTYDVLGSNTFVYRIDGEDSPLMMGPLWDFDSSFRCEKETWSLKHTSESFYYPQLFSIPEFVAVYVETYKALRPGIMEYMKEFCRKFEEKYAQAFEESVALHKMVYPGECRNTLHDQLLTNLQKLEERLTYLDALVEELLHNSQILPVSSSVSQPVKIFSISGMRIPSSSNLPKGLYIHSLGNGRNVKVVK